MWLQDSDLAIWQKLGSETMINPDKQSNHAPVEYQYKFWCYIYSKMWPLNDRCDQLLISSF